MDNCVGRQLRDDENQVLRSHGLTNDATNHVSHRRYFSRLRLKSLFCVHRTAAAPRSALLSTARAHSLSCPLQQEATVESKIAPGQPRPGTAPSDVAP